MVRELVPKEIDLAKVDVWSEDETRVGQQGSLTRIWAKRGTRPRKVLQQQFISPIFMEPLAMQQVNHVH